MAAFLGFIALGVVVYIAANFAAGRSIKKDDDRRARLALQDYHEEAEMMRAKIARLEAENRRLRFKLDGGSEEDIPD